MCPCSDVGNWQSKVAIIDMCIYNTVGLTCINFLGPMPQYQYIRGYDRFWVDMSLEVRLIPAVLCVTGAKYSTLSLSLPAIADNCLKHDLQMC